MWNKNQKNVTIIFGKIPTILAKRLDEIEIVEWIEPIMTEYYFMENDVLVSKNAMFLLQGLHLVSIVTIVAPILIKHCPFASSVWSGLTIIAWHCLPQV